MNRELHVGATRLELLTDGDAFLGIGRVWIGDTQLRSGSAPWRVEVRTPDGVRFERFALQNISTQGDETRLELLAMGERGLRGDAFDDFEVPLMRFSLRSGEQVSDRLTWILRPDALELDGEQFIGFSYALEWASKERAIYHLSVLATWELGGSVEGVTILHQRQCTIPSAQLSRDGYWSSAIVKSLSAPLDDPLNQSMQLNSRHGTIQAFDYQHSAYGQGYRIRNDELPFTLEHYQSLSC